jgi:hypothetical protein
MALRVIDGVPGSGKTFYAVRHLALHYFRKSPLTGLYHLDRDCLIVTNIDGFKPEHLGLQGEIEKAGAAARAKIESSDLTERRKDAALEKLDPVAEFFSYEYQERFKEDKPPLVYVIDEAQRYFRKGMDRVLKERRVFDYFEYHRHWGQDIYLVTQNVRKLPADIVYLPEYIVCAVPRSRSIGIGFKYHWVSSGETIKTETCRADPEIFDLYQSMDVDASVPEPAAVEPASSSGSYVPVVSSGPAAEPEEIQPHYVVFLPLDSITLYTGGRMTTHYVWRGHYFLPRDFPHKTVVRAGRRHAVLDYDLFTVIFSDEQERPSDFIVQVAAPESMSGDGGGSDDRSAARSDSSGGRARRGTELSEQG